MGKNEMEYRRYFVPRAWPVQRHASAAARATLSPVAHTARLRMVRYGG